MKVAVTGSSGFIGSALIPLLTARGDDVIRVKRDAAEKPDIRWDIDAGTIDAEGLEGVDAVIHLAGEGIGDRRWTDAHERRVKQSRVAGTTLLAETLASLAMAPRVLLSGSAIGWYGERGNETLTEASGPGTEVKAEICTAWENAASPAVDAGIRTVFLRTGMVLSPDGGALGEALPFFKLGLMGRFGDGRQWWAWISMEDQLRAMLFLLDNEISGPVNLVAPHPVTNSEYTKTVGSALHRPTLIPTPRFALNLRLGAKGAQAVALTSAKVIPEVLLEHGFTFRHPHLEGALASML